MRRVFAMLLAVSFAAPALAAEDPRKREPTGWEAKLSKPDEPGEPFEMTGTLLTPSGDPLPNVKMFFYHADAKGNYTLTKEGPLHLAAVLRTDADGRYRIRSVFPGSYGYAPHVHYELLDKPFGQGFLNVRRVGIKSPQEERSTPVQKDKDGVWRLRKDLTPRGPAAGTRVPEIRYPPSMPADSAR